MHIASSSLHDTILSEKRTIYPDELSIRTYQVVSKIKQNQKICVDEVEPWFDPGKYSPHMIGGVDQGRFQLKARLNMHYHVFGRLSQQLCP